MLNFFEYLIQIFKKFVILLCFIHSIISVTIGRNTVYPHFLQGEAHMSDQFTRTRMLMGQVALDKLAAARVIVFGVGGVGGHAAEALARAGVGRIDLVDKDDVDVTNINRQIIALHSTVGKPKAEVAKARILDINPTCEVVAHQCFFLPETADQFNFADYDYVVDAVDTVTAKIQLVVQAQTAGTPIISCMGTGNKLDPTKLEVSDIYKTKVDKLAKVVRHELRKRDIKSLKVVYSQEEPLPPLEGERTPASISFVPSVAGLIIAGEVIKDLTGIRTAEDR